MFHESNRFHVGLDDLEVPNSTIFSEKVGGVSSLHAADYVLNEDMWDTC